MGDTKKKGPRQDRKVFCGGLHSSTDKESLGEYFSQFGEVEDAHVMLDGDTRGSRGFGFVVFSELSGLEDCLDHETHVVDGKEVEVKKAIPKEEQKTKKVFVGGLDPDTTEEDIKDAFVGFGLVGVKIMTEKLTEKPRGFAFAFFDEYESADRVVEQQRFTIKDRQVEVKKAVPRDEMDKVSKRKPVGRSSAESPPHHHAPRDPYMYPHPMDLRMHYDYYHRFPEVSSHYSSGFGRYPSGYAYGSSSYDMYPSSRGYGSYMSSPTSLGSSYSQSASGYGPSRVSYEKERMPYRSSGYHPYSRR